MATNPAYDAAVIGAGPNGLAAAITLARAGRSVVVYEGSETIGGGCRSKELTLPGFVPTSARRSIRYGVASPFFQSLPLERYGLEWVHPPAPLAHPLPDGRAAVLERDPPRWTATLGADARGLAAALRAAGRALGRRSPTARSARCGRAHQLRHPLRVAARWRASALYALQSARGLAERTFHGGPGARALRRHRGARDDAAGAAADGRGGHAAGDDGACGGLAAGARRLAAHRGRAGGVPARARRRDRHRARRSRRWTSCRRRARSSPT